MQRFTICLAALLAASSAFAQSPASLVTMDLSPLVVTAPTGTPQPLDTTLAPVIVLGPAQLKPFGDADLATLLQFQAGLDIARNGGPGQPASLFLRGTGSSETLVRVDGIRVNPGSIGGPPLSNILASSLGRVEIVEAPRSALYGSDAIGGVIDITTRQPTRDGFAWGAGISGGHDASRGASAHAGGGNGTFFGGAGVDFFETGGYPQQVGSIQDSAWRNLSVNATFGAQGESGEAYANVWRSSGTSDYLDYSLNPVSEDYTDRVASVHLSRQMNADWSSRMIVGQYYNNIQQIQAPDYLDTWRNSADWRNDITLGSHQLLSVGMYLAHQHVNALSYGTGYDRIHDDQALYAQEQIAWGVQRIVLAGRMTHFSSFGDQFTWNADYGLRFAQDWRLTAGAGTGFRAPTATDRYGYGGNPDLRPEYSHSLNAGLYRQLGSHAQIGLNLYRNRVSDLITYEATSTGGQEQNIGQATITGANLTARMNFGAWRIQPGINIQRPLNDQTGGYLPRRTRRSLTLNVGYSVRHWQVGAHFLAAGRTKDSDFSATTNAGYLLTTLTGGFKFARHWQIRARLDNVFDVHYQT
ncbi:MAG: TonB-dependent receptor, partial [Gammaproteobacteria bacterium]